MCKNNGLLIALYVNEIYLIIDNQAVRVIGYSFSSLFKRRVHFSLENGLRIGFSLLKNPFNCVNFLRWLPKDT